MHNSVSSSCSGGSRWCTVLFGSCSVTILCSNCFEEIQGTLREFSLNQCDKLDGKKCFFNNFADFRFRHKFSVTLQRIFQPLAPRPCAQDHTVPSFGHEHFWLTLPVRQRCEDEQFLVDESRVAFLYFVYVFYWWNHVFFFKRPHGTAFFFGSMLPEVRQRWLWWQRLVLFYPSSNTHVSRTDLQAGARATPWIMVLALGTAARAWWWGRMVEWWCLLCHSPS